MALVQSGELAVYGRFLHCPLFRAICGAWRPRWAPARSPVLGSPTKTAGRCGYRVRLGGRKSDTGQVRLSPSPWPVAGPLVSRKRWSYPTQRSCSKTHADRLQRGKGGLPHLARAVFGAILGMGALAAFGESCRCRGHGLTARFDPLRSWAENPGCAAARCRGADSVRLDACELHHLGPFSGLIGDELAEVVGG